MAEAETGVVQLQAKEQQTPRNCCRLGTGFRDSTALKRFCSSILQMGRAMCACGFDSPTL